MKKTTFNLKLSEEIKKLLDQLYFISGIPRTQIIIQGIKLRGKQIVEDKKRHNLNQEFLKKPVREN